MNLILALFRLIVGLGFFAMTILLFATIGFCIGGGSEEIGGRDRTILLFGAELVFLLFFGMAAILFAILDSPPANGEDKPHELD